MGVDLRKQTRVQAQGDVGVLGGVGGSLVDGYLLKADLPDALAAEIAVRDGDNSR